ncbi:protein rep [Kitasatospora sp. NPDC087861]|uniref:protein rep n=1 Tax=Kitasatospora sp. NPDC087861 TaxID=3364070 RepID=UPI00380C9A8D
MAPTSGNAWKKRRADRYASRRLLWRWSALGPVRACGRGVVDHEQGVVLKVGADGRSHASGLTTCKSIWACPVCQAVIRAERANDISEGAARHVANGGTAYLVTLTARHYKRHALEDLRKAMSRAYKALISGAQWAGDPTRGREGERARMGVLGVMRSVEVTWGENGWHPHLHLVVLLGGVRPQHALTDRERGLDDEDQEAELAEIGPQPVAYFRVPDPGLSKADRAKLSPAEAVVLGDFERMQARWLRIWQAWLAKEGFRPNAKRAISWDRLERVADAKKAGAYVAKTQDDPNGKKRGRAAGNELARLDMKSARRIGNLTPMEILQEARRLQSEPTEQDIAAGVEKRVAQLHAVWLEYESATRGWRAIEWTRGLRVALGMTEEKTDDEVMEAEATGEAYGFLDTESWRRICRLNMDTQVHEAYEEGGIAALVRLLTSVHLILGQPTLRTYDEEGPDGTVRTVTVPDVAPAVEAD